MNSYPVELLVQHAPLMFVAGLDGPVVSPGSSTQPLPTPPQPVKAARTPGSPPALTEPSINPLDAASQDPFVTLASRLRNALMTKKKSVVWDPEHAKSFQVVLVDKGVRLPPRKIYPPQSRPDEAPVGPPHSPLSPLSPTSPLFPDGLINPIWVRKHMELVPSVFVLFLRLWESPLPKSPLEARDIDREDERRRDAELALEIGTRKKAASERGIKLTVVLMTSRRTLDDPSLDTRLSFIRRQSGLDSRAALFVLSPVSAPELAEFVKSLQEALWESSIEYYAAHSKRVRRKRNRHGHAQSALPLTTATTSRPLRPEGWAVRYEYKLATFAEFRGELEIARKHYEDCWEGLSEMFGSTAILAPRTKRWAEAKALADCMTLKICKLYLYHEEHSRALGHFNRHIHRFSDLSRGWGIGEETFEYWSWMAKQYRVFAELLEQAMRAGYQIPDTSKPVPPIPAAPTSVPPTNGVVVEGINPARALLHPGLYYHMAAACTRRRYDRFLAISGQENAPGFANEKNVDHPAVIVDLYNRAYELLKKSKSGHSRLTFYIAYRIAESYFSSGKYDVAIKFFERMAKTSRKDKWGRILRPILVMWYECAKRLGETELCVRLLMEMISSDTVTPEERALLVKDLKELFKTPPPSDNLLIIDTTDCPPLFDASLIFWNTSVFVGEPASFQISLTSSKTTALPSLSFSALTIQFENHPPIVINHSEEALQDGSERKPVDLGKLTIGDDAEIEIRANLAWQSTTSVKIFSGTIVSHTPRDIRMSKVIYTLREESWTLEIPLLPNPPSQLLWRSSSYSVPIYDEHPSVLSVKSPPHLLHVQLTHKSPAYLNEEYPVVIEISNNDHRNFHIILDVLLQPLEDDTGVMNYIRVDEQKAAGLLKLDIGQIAPGTSESKILHLFSGGVVGKRIIDISVRSQVSLEEPSDSVSPLDADITETLRTIEIQTTDPFKAEFQTSFHRPDTKSLVLNMATMNPDTFEPWTEATVTAKVMCAGPHDVLIESVSLKPADNALAKLLHSSHNEANREQIVWQTDDGISVVSRISLISDINVEEQGAPQACGILFPGEIEISWRRSATQGEISKTRIGFPLVRPPADTCIAIVRPPAVAQLHEPFILPFVIHNRHPNRTADILLQIESSESFVLAGPRAACVPIILAGSTFELAFNVVPLVCGLIRLPGFKLLDRRKSRTRRERPQEAGEEGRKSESGELEEPIAVVDWRWEARDESGEVLDLYAEDSTTPAHLVEVGGGGITVFVEP